MLRAFFNKRAQQSDLSSGGDKSKTRGDDVKIYGDDFKICGDNFKTRSDNFRTRSDNLKTRSDDFKIRSNGPKTCGNGFRTRGNDSKISSDNFKSTEHSHGPGTHQLVKSQATKSDEDIGLHSNRPATVSLNSSKAAVNNAMYLRILKIQKPPKDPKRRAARLARKERKRKAIQYLVDSDGHMVPTNNPADPCQYGQYENRLSRDMCNWTKVQTPPSNPETSAVVPDITLTTDQGETFYLENTGEEYDAHVVPKITLTTDKGETFYLEDIGERNCADSDFDEDREEFIEEANIARGNELGSELWW
ncbi:hypothetical protein QBC38DRAFT_486354 [Podospora fimiseda]|uniref:Uncharacterized protein n=1 Tax=Podospora fimiseda TaxID=252190 RepID=A0AAN7BIU6_9PEZI|nr:hypothetical protein QBC38DRAFT_486354 [Podospora fimiseda]